MQTQFMSNETATVWLEPFNRDGDRPEAIALETFPFTVGRSDSCHLTIDSHRVSREHAKLEPSEDGAFCVLDLESTNGTFVNGQRIHRAELSDGDLVGFADAKFRFRSSNGSLREAATQVFESNAAPADNATPSWDVVREVRRLQEQLTQSAVETCLVPVVDLSTGSRFGVAADQPDLPETSLVVHQLLKRAESPLLARWNRMCRAVALEQACQLSGPGNLFLPFESFEAGLDDFPASLAQLCGVNSSEIKLVAEFPVSAACNVPYFRELLETVRQSGIGVAYGGFAGGERQLNQFREFAPDYVKLCPSSTRDIAHDDRPRHQLQAVVRAAAEIDCAVIAAGISASEDADACRDLGCQFAQGEYFRDEHPLVVPVEQQLIEIHAS